MFGIEVEGCFLMQDVIERNLAGNEFRYFEPTEDSSIVCHGDGDSDDDDSDDDDSDDDPDDDEEDTEAMEYVSRPFSLRQLKKHDSTLVKELDALMDAVRPCDGGSCGMHVHASSPQVRKKQAPGFVLLLLRNWIRSEQAKFTAKYYGPQQRKDNMYARQMTMDDLLVPTKYVTLNVLPSFVDAAEAVPLALQADRKRTHADSWHVEFRAFAQLTVVTRPQLVAYVQDLQTFLQRTWTQYKRIKDTTAYFVRLLQKVFRTSFPAGTFAPAFARLAETYWMRKYEGQVAPQAVRAHFRRAETAAARRLGSAQARQVLHALGLVWGTRAGIRHRDEAQAFLHTASAAHWEAVAAMTAEAEANMERFAAGVVYETVDVQVNDGQPQRIRILNRAADKALHIEILPFGPAAAWKRFLKTNPTRKVTVRLTTTQYRVPGTYTVTRTPPYKYEMMFLDGDGTPLGPIFFAVFSSARKYRV
jgi:hypothetical protein